MLNDRITAFTKDITEYLNKTTQLNVQLQVGETEASLVATISRIAPFSKVAIVAQADSYSRLAPKLFQLVREANAYPVGIIINDCGLVKVEALAELFALPDDVRAVLSIDSNISNVANYFASIRGIPHLSIVTDWELDGVLNCSLFIKCGNSINRMICEAERVIHIDVKGIIKHPPNKKKFAVSVLKNVMALYDYRLSEVYNANKTCQGGYALINEGLTRLISSIKTGDWINCLLSELIMQIGNLLTGCKIYDNSAFVQYFMLYKVVGLGGIDFADKIVPHIYSRYNSATRGVLNKGKAYQVANEIKEIEEVSNLIGIDRGALLRYRQGYDKLKDCKRNRLAITMLGFSNDVEEYKEFFNAVGIEEAEANELKQLDKAVKYFPYGFNLLKV